MVLGASLAPNAAHEMARADGLYGDIRGQLVMRISLAIIGVANCSMPQRLSIGRVGGDQGRKRKRKSERQPAHCRTILAACGRACP